MVSVLFKGSGAGEAKEAAGGGGPRGAPSPAWPVGAACGCVCPGSRSPAVGRWAQQRRGRAQRVVRRAQAEERRALGRQRPVRIVHVIRVVARGGARAAPGAAA